MTNWEPSWELSIGLYPGVLIGARTYQNKEYTEHVIYVPFVEMCLTIYKDDPNLS
jgi:hypothetical protein